MIVSHNMRNGVEGGSIGGLRTTEVGHMCSCIGDKVPAYSVVDHCESILAF